MISLNLAELFKRRGLVLHDRHGHGGSDVARPNTADPSMTTATVLRLIVSRRASAGLFAIATHTRATPGV